MAQPTKTAKTGASSIQRKQKAAADKNKPVDLYSLFIKGTDSQVYVGSGVPLERAEELAVRLVTTPEVRLVRLADGSLPIADEILEDNTAAVE